MENTQKRMIKASIADKRCCGFTLVEMSITMIIVGLVLGVIVIGQDLIRSAETRATVSQIEGYQAAVNTFRSKYNGLPGDLIAREASGFDFTTRSGAAGHGDGNGFIEGCGEGEIVAGCETVLFWVDLADAFLIEGDYIASDDIIYMSAWLKLQKLLQTLNPIQTAYAGLPVDNSPPPPPPPPPAPTHRRDEIANLFPEAETGDLNSMLVYYANGKNYFQIAGVQSTDSDGSYNLSSEMTPIEAYSIDIKYDDGNPGTGDMRAMGGAGPLGVSAVPAAGGCVSNSSSNPYNTGSAVMHDKLCQLRVSIR